MENKMAKVSSMISMQNSSKMDIGKMEYFKISSIT
jgi:hypothetical protein